MGAGFEAAIDMHRTVMEVEMAHNLRRDYDQGGEKLSARLRQLIERGRQEKAADYLRAWRAENGSTKPSTRYSTNTMRS